MISVDVTPNAVRMLEANVPNAVLIAAFPASVVYDVVSLTLHATAFPDVAAVAVPALTGDTVFSEIPLKSVSAREVKSPYVIVPNDGFISSLQGS